MNNNKLKDIFSGIRQRVKDSIAYKKVKLQEQTRGKNRHEKYNCVKFNKLEIDYDPKNMKILREVNIILDELREKIKEENFVLAKIESINIGEGKCFDDVNVTIDSYTTKIVDDIVFKEMPWFGIKAYEINPIMYRKLDRTLPVIYEQIEKLEKMSNDYSIQILIKNLKIENGIVIIDDTKILKD